MTLGERIKAKRTSDEISAQKLAKLLGTSKENVYKWEAGSTPSDPEVYNKIIKWLENVPQETPNPQNLLSASFDVLQQLEARRLEAVQRAEELKADKAELVSIIKKSQDTIDNALTKLGLSLGQGQHQIKEQINAVAVNLEGMIEELQQKKSERPRPSLGKGTGLTGPGGRGDGKGKKH